MATPGQAIAAAAAHNVPFDADEIANRMALRGSGTIIGVSSVAGERGRDALRDWLNATNP